MYAKNTNREVLTDSFTVSLARVKTETTSPSMCFIIIYKRL